MDDPCVLGHANHTDGYVRRRHRGQLWYEHRWVYEQEYGPIPDSLTIDHLCRNKNCLNPRHMEPVTGAENARRGQLALARGLCPHGARVRSTCKGCHIDRQRRYLTRRVTP